MTDYYLNIGSNLGDRRANIELALSALEGAFGGVEVSETTTSEPWGFESSHAFMNVGVRISSPLPPEDVLAVTKGIERTISPESHRNPDCSYADRVIDIDIVAAGGIIVDTPALRVPHPCLPLREFFLRPMISLAPAWRHPASGLTCAEMLEKLNSRKNI